MVLTFYTIVTKRLILSFYGLILISVEVTAKTGRAGSLFAPHLE